MILLTSGRRSGKTKMVCEHAKKFGLTVLAYSEQQAKYLERNFGVKTKVLRKTNGTRS